MAGEKWWNGEGWQETSGIGGWLLLLFDLFQERTKGSRVDFGRSFGLFFFFWDLDSDL